MINKLVEASNFIHKTFTDVYNIKILDYIEKEPKTVKQIEEHLKISQRSTIAHLNTLEKYDVIKKTPKVIKGKGGSKVNLVSLTDSRQKLGKKIFKKYVGDEAERLAKDMAKKGDSTMLNFYKQFTKEQGL